MPVDRRTVWLYLHLLCFIKIAEHPICGLNDYSTRGWCVCVIARTNDSLTAGIEVTQGQVIFGLACVQVRKGQQMNHQRTEEEEEEANGTGKELCHQAPNLSV